MNPLDRSSLLLSTAAQALADFLRIDLEVGFTLADLAMRETDGLGMPKRLNATCTMPRR